MYSYIGEIRLVAFGYPMDLWHLCDGTELPVNDSYRALYKVLGNTYGGQTDKTFRLPNLNNRYPIGAGYAPGLPAYNLGSPGGNRTATINMNQMPRHTHPGTFDPTGGTVPTVTASFLAENAVPNSYIQDGCSLTVTAAGGRPIFADAPGTNPQAIAGTSAVVTPGELTGTSLSQVGFAGNNVPLSLQPAYQTLLYVICLFGIFPIRPS